MKLDKNSMTVVIRSAGERTESLCRELILGQGLREEDVVVVRERPFSMAMRVSFERGMERGLPWTFCVDADVLPRPGALGEMLRLACGQEASVCEIQGFVLDRFFGGPRKAGNHLYRTSLLPRVCECIPDEGTDIRPEHYTLKKMRDRGFPWVNVFFLMGLHDYEQSYFDIFRKCFVQAHKHLHYTQLFVEHWREQAYYNEEFRVALNGFAAGIRHFGSVLIDTGQSEYQTEFTKLGISERAPLSLKDFAPHGVDEIIESWKPPASYQQYFPESSKLSAGAGKTVPHGRVYGSGSVQNSRFLYRVSHAIGCLLCRAGNLLQKVPGHCRVKQ